MSLFAYTVYLADRTSKTGQVTAKTEVEAKRKILELHPLGTNLKVSVKDEARRPDAKKVSEQPAEKAVKQPAKKAVKQAAKKTAKKAVKKKVASGLTKLRKMLYLQSGKCFFCGEDLPLERATIEHLHPRSKGGPSTADNEVVCCAELNHTFADMELKRKFEFVLKSAGHFKCPKV